jgi:alanyl-tRNA synthetase
VVKAIYTGSEYIATAYGDLDFGLVLESTSFYAEQGGQVRLLDSAVFDIDRIVYSCIWCCIYHSSH